MARVSKQRGRRGAARRPKVRQESLALDLPRARHTAIVMTDAEFRELRSLAVLASKTLTAVLTDLAREYARKALGR